jgi:deoxyribose-phosphate aldolase
MLPSSPKLSVEAQVLTMRKTVGRSAQVRASTGVVDWPTALCMLSNGATRLGMFCW